MQFDRVMQPIVVGDTVIFGSSSDDHVIALDAKTGAIRWTFVCDGPVRFAPVAWRDKVYVVSDDGHLYALALSDGRLIWKHRGGPNDQKIIGNERMISHWPARGGPVVFANNVFYAAGIWPSDGVSIHALDAESGHQVWANKKTGSLEMDQPHGGARAKSGVSAQGYLLASEELLFVPTGRGVAAAFGRSDGELSYYHLQKNSQRGGAWAMLADDYLFNAGCLFQRSSGELVSQIGSGAMVATPNGIVRTEGKSLAVYLWKDAQRKDRRGESHNYRALEKNKLVDCEENVISLIVAGSDAVCGENGRVCAVDYTRQRNTWWSHKVEGKALGLAYGNGHLVVSTDRGMVYCFDGQPATSESPSNQSQQPNNSASSRPERKAIDLPAAVGQEAVAKIVKATGIDHGYCVDLSCGNGDLLVELARQTKLQIYAVESDPNKVSEARKKLVEAGLYGVRVTVHQGNPTATGLPDRFANLVLSTTSLSDGKISPEMLREMRRIQRPYGGTLCSGQRNNLKVERGGDLVGAGSWTHQNSNPANTLCSDDKLIKGPLGMRWFRDVDFLLPNRHGQAPAPLYHRGIMVVGGLDGLCALDAYNGHTLWVHDLPGNLSEYDGIHHDVGVGETGSNFCLSDDSVYVRNGATCRRIDLQTGSLLAEYHIPSSDDKENVNWGFLAFSDGLIYGSVLNEGHRVSPRYKLSSLRTESVSFFALDPNTREVVWMYKADDSIRNNAIAIGGGSVYLIDREIPVADHVSNPKRNGRHGPLLKPGEHKSGLLLALDARSGEVRWKNDADIFGTQLAVSLQHQVLLMNFQAVRHNFFKLPSETGGRLAGFDTKTGRRLWNQLAEYETRPLINDDLVFAQGGAWNLKTGKPVSFPFSRSYGCGQISASTNLMLFRSGTLGYLDLTRDAGTENYGGTRPSCWINAIPAGGIVLVPEGSTKCNCSYQMKAWFALGEQRFENGSKDSQ